MSMTDQRDTIVSLLIELASEQPDLPLYTFLDPVQQQPAVLTTRELLCSAQKIAGMLQARQLTGEPVMVLGAYGSQAIVLLFGAILAGCQPVPVTFHTRLGMANIVSLIAQTGLRVVIGEQATLAKLKSGRSRSRPRFYSSRHNLIYLATDDVQASGWRQPAISDTDVALIYPGQVSDEDTMPVPLTHGDLLRSTDDLIRVLSIGPETCDRFLSCLDLADGLALVLHILVPMRARLASFLFPLERALSNGAHWVMAASDHDCTIISAPVSVLSVAAQDVANSAKASIDLSKLRYVCIGGNDFTPAMVSSFIDRYGNNGMSVDKIFSCYGLSPAGAYLAGRLGFKTLVKDYVAYLALGVPDGRSLRMTETGDRWMLMENELYCVGRIEHCFTVDGRHFQAEDIESFIFQRYRERGLSRCVVLRIEESRETVVLAECATRQLAECWQGVVPEIKHRVFTSLGCLLDRVILLRPGSLSSAVSGIVLRQNCADALTDGSLMLRLLPVRGK